MPRAFVSLEAGPSGGEGGKTKWLLDDKDEGGGKGNGKAQRQRSGQHWLDENRSGEDHGSKFEDSSIHDMDGDVVETAEVEPVKPTVHETVSSPRRRPLYHLADDEDNINKEVHHGLLNPRFRPTM
ncbi:hypothetical protein Q9L58_001875 [Maublancomyces gigas]|uniref:Uncharacterized protein n=1 Tax=Discina gigas TaxID=1032678 RepID=A0ABR3GT64_9PEZI